MGEPQREEPLTVRRGRYLWLHPVLIRIQCPDVAHERNLQLRAPGDHLPLALVSLLWSGCFAFGLNVRPRATLSSRNMPAHI